MTLKFTEVTTDGNIVLLIEGPEEEAFKFFQWCVESFNIGNIDLWIMKVQRSLLTSIEAETGKVVLPDEPEMLEPFYQISYLTEDNLILFRLRWLDEHNDIKQINATTKEV